MIACLHSGAGHLQITGKCMASFLFARHLTTPWIMQGIFPSGQIYWLIGSHKTRLG